MVEIEHDVLARVAELFRLGRPTGPAVFVDRGVSGQVFAVTTASGRWAAKRLYRQPDPGQLEIEVGLQESVRSAGVVSPRAVRDPGGALAAAVDGATWRVNEWVDSCSTDADRFAPGRLAEVGGLLARIHGLRLPAEHGVVDWLRTSPAQSVWKDLRAAVAESSASWRSKFMDWYPELGRLRAAVASASFAEPVLSHCDLGPANVAVGADGLVVFDWERAGAIPPAQELGYVLTQWCSSRVGLAAHVVEGYRAAGLPVRPRLDMFACAVNAWLNFFPGQAWAALRTDDEERRPELERSVSAMLEQPMTVRWLELLLDSAAART